MAKLQRVGTNASPLVAVPRPDAKDEPKLVSEVDPMQASGAWDIFPAALGRSQEDAI